MRAMAVSKLMDTAGARPQTKSMDDVDKQDTIEKVTARIVARHPDAPRTLVARVVAEEYDQLASSRIRTYIPTLIENGARNRIKSEIASRSVEGI